MYAAAVTDQTRESYARRWDEFTGWRRRNGFPALPATPEVLMLYLSHGADSGYSVATLRGRAAAINRVHVEAGEARRAEERRSGSSGMAWPAPCPHQEP